MKSVRASSRLSSSWSALLLALVVAAVALALYLPTLAPTITWHNNGADSGDLATAVVTLGIAHPPGYPTYVLLGRAWLALPFGGDPAFRLNLMSAASAALAASLTTVAVLVLGRRLGASGVPLALGAVWSGLALASAPLPWASAVIGEKFAPGLALVSLISLLVLRWQTPLPPRGPALVALLGGLGLGLLPQVALAAPGVLGVLVARAGKAALHPGYWLPIGFAAIVGLSVFLYLPWRAAANPLANWGDPGTPERFWAHVAARQYYTHFFDAGPREWLARLAEGGLLVAQNLTWIGVGLAALGVYLLWRSDRAALWYLGTLIALTVLVRTSYSTYRDVMYLLPALQALTILVGLGAVQLLGAAQRELRAVGIGATACALLAVLAVRTVATAPGIDASGDWRADHTSRAVLAALPPDAIVVSGFDELTFSLWYRQALGERRDVVVIERRLFDREWYQDNLLRSYPDLDPTALRAGHLTTLGRPLYILSGSPDALRVDPADARPAAP